MFKEKKIDLEEFAEAEGVYRCSNCGSGLFEANKKFDAHCGFPSFWVHIEDHVELKQLSTYGRERIQLLCKSCGQHLGHLFENKLTPTKVRYCVTHDSISFTLQEED